MVDEFYMRQALSLAYEGTSMASPNPLVGCVIVRDGKVIGRGAHLSYGGHHAEVNAFISANCDIKNSTVYTTLEPCSHIGKTPPCTDLLIKNKVARVVVGMIDPNPLVNSRGLEILQKEGIDVTHGILEKECKWSNRGFIRSKTLRRPWVTIKIASSIDGNIALINGDSKWITSYNSRQKAHILRSESDAILTGVGTILADNPELNVRLSEGKSPKKIILDTRLKTPITSKIFNDNNVLIFTSVQAPKEKINEIKSLGAVVEIIDASSSKNAIDIVLNKLCEYGVNYLLVEAGAKITSSFLAAKAIDSVSFYIAPKLLGKGVSFSEYIFVKKIDKALKLKTYKYYDAGEDFLLEGVLSCSPEL